MERLTLLTIHHYPDRKKPCLVLQQGNQGWVIGTIRNEDAENALKQFFNSLQGDNYITSRMENLFEEE